MTEVERWQLLQQANSILPCEVLRDVLDTQRSRAAARDAMMQTSLMRDLARWADDGGREP